jgi:hypothetical protein
MQKGIVYYTDNELDPKIMKACQDQLLSVDLPIVSVSLKPIDFGENHVLPLERSALTMFKQILRGIEESVADILFFCECDVLYHPSHFEFTPSRDDYYYYNINVWKVDWLTGHGVHVNFCQQVSGLCAYRSLLLQHYRERVKRVEKDGYSNAIGYEPGTHNRPEKIDDYKAASWISEFPNVDIRHDKNFSSTRWRKDQFRNQRYTDGWIESDSIPGWDNVVDLWR